MSISAEFFKNFIDTVIAKEKEKIITSKHHEKQLKETKQISCVVKKREQLFERANQIY